MPKDDYEKHSQYAPKTEYTGPSIPSDGDHIHAILGDMDYTFANPGSYEISGLPLFTDYEVSAYCDANENNVRDFDEAGGACIWNPVSVEYRSSIATNA